MKNVLSKNEIYDTVIERYSSDASGICHIQGMTVFVPNAIPGEKIRVKIVKVHAAYAYGKIEEIYSSSEYRTDPDCPWYSRCGGCDTRHICYQEELQMKKDTVNDALRRIGHLDLTVPTVTESPDFERYRNKVSYSYANREGQIVHGFYRERTHDVIPVTDCLLQPELFSRIAAVLTKLLNRFGFKAYEEKDGSGSIRHLFLRSAHKTGETVVVISSARGFGEYTQYIVRELTERFPEISGILLNIDKESGNKLLKGDFHTLWGKDTITDILCGLSFELSPLSFYQINSPQAEKLYEKVREFAVCTKDDSILDLYCGIGTISLVLAKEAKHVVGVEIVEAAIENAKRNAVRNRLENAEFYCSDAASFQAYTKKNGFIPDCVVVDPPRKGLDRETILNICSYTPERVVYVSCNPATLARDLCVFSENGYSVDKLAAYDMFPKTCHVETVALLFRDITTHYMNLDPTPYEMIKSGLKTIELRLFDEKRQQIKPGDTILFTNTDTGETLFTTVLKLHCFQDFETLYQTLPLLQCGYSEEDVAQAKPSDMEQYYSIEKQQKYGVVGIELFPK